LKRFFLDLVSYIIDNHFCKGYTWW